MSLFAMLKQNARRALRGNWGKAVLILLLYLVVLLVYAMFSTMVANTFIIRPFASNPTMTHQNPLDLLRAAMPQLTALQTVGMIFTILLLYPFQMGMLHWNLEVVKKGTESFSGIFYFFEKIRRYGRSILFSLNMILRATFWSIVFLAVPTAVMSVTAYFTRQYMYHTDRRFAVYAGVGTILSIAMVLLAVILYAAYMKKYYLAPYLLASDNNFTVGGAIKESARQTKGYRFSLLGFEFSFLGWAILCIPLPPLLFYVAPYMSASMAMYAQYLMETRRREVENAPQPNATREFSTRKTSPDASGTSLTDRREPELFQTDRTAEASLKNDASWLSEPLPKEETPRWPDIPPPWQDIPAEDTADERSDEEADVSGKEAGPGNGRSNRWPFD